MRKIIATGPRMLGVAKDYIAPKTAYFKTKIAFDEAVGQDFIKVANETTIEDRHFLVGLAHGQSPSGAYKYILENLGKIKHPQRIHYTFTNSRLEHQRGLEGVMDATNFLIELYRLGMLTKDQIFGRHLNRENLVEYAAGFNQTLGAYLVQQNKKGLDYVFLASDPTGRVAAITRNSTAFESKDIVVLVHDRKEPEITMTPHFLMQSKRLAFLATKADKRRPLAWLYYRWGKIDESPSFLRHMENVRERMKVFIDDKALTWPQIEITREATHGQSTIRIDLARPYEEYEGKKLPVVLLVHGFLGLNSFDGLLTALPSHKYIAAALHYGSIPNELPPKLYSQHVVNNIDAVADYFGSKGHPIYIFDHSMGNMYFLIMEREFDKLQGLKKYLCGRIGANPFFGEEAKHALVGFMDNVIVPSLSYRKNFAEKALIKTFRRVVPMDGKTGVRHRGIRLSAWLIKKDSRTRDRIWKSVKKRILHLMTNLDSVPELNKIPIERALNRLPAKIFAIQVHSALEESKNFDKQTELKNMEAHQIPILILKSEKDAVAKFVPRLYQSSVVKIKDITNPKEKDLFREHLFHMVNPLRTTQMIEDFIDQNEKKRAGSPLK